VSTEIGLTTSHDSDSYNDSDSDSGGNSDSDSDSGGKSDSDGDTGGDGDGDSDDEVSVCMAFLCFRTKF
jgi:hypothetical protein